MQILSLNVNGFVGDKDKRECDNITASISERNVKKVLDKMFERLNPEIIMLSEFNAHSYAGEYATRYLKNKRYIPVYPDNRRSVYNNIKSIVMGFTKKEVMSEKSPKISLTLKWNEIVYEGYRIIGVHIPSYDGRARAAIDFWESVKQHYEDHKEERVIYIGDMNVFDEGTKTIKRFKELLDAGATDAWQAKRPEASLEKSCTYITPGRIKKRLDYAIMSKSAYDNLNKIENLQDFLKEGLSDHSAILVDVKDIK